MPNDSTHPSQPGLTTSETIETLLQRRSIRKYSDAPVTDAQVDAILQAAFRAPTSSNIQSYTVITVRTRKPSKSSPCRRAIKNTLSTAPVFLAFCADLTRLEHVLQERGHTLEDNNLEIGLVSSIDASLVGMSAYLAADSLGIKGVMIGAVEERCRKDRRNSGTTEICLLRLRHVSWLSGGNATTKAPDGPKFHRPSREIPAGENRALG